MYMSGQPCFVAGAGAGAVDFEHHAQPGATANSVNDEGGADCLARADHDTFDHRHLAGTHDQIGHRRAGPHGYGRLGGQRLADDSFVDGAPGTQQGVSWAVPQVDGDLQHAPGLQRLQHIGGLVAEHPYRSGEKVVRMPCLGHARTGPAGEEHVGACPGRVSVAFDKGDAMTAAGQEQGGGEPAQAASYHDDMQIVPVHVAQRAGAGAGVRPSCSSIASRSKIRLKEMCLPSRKRSTWM